MKGRRMEKANTTIKNKSSLKAQTLAIRIKADIRKKIKTDLLKVNKKSYGRKVIIDDYLKLAVSLITSEHLKQLQEASLSHFDRFEITYYKYVKQHGSISKDAYMGAIMRGEIKPEV